MARQFAICTWITVLVGVCGNTWAQPPQMRPPVPGVEPPAAENGSGDLSIQGLVFLDAYGVRIYMPRISYERFLEFETGASDAERRWSFQRVKIDGRVSGDKADLNVEVRIQVDATDGDTIEIPLAMENFFSLGPPAFFQGDDAGNQLRIGHCS